MKAVIVPCFLLVLAGCGFHLRTARMMNVPSTLATLRVTMPSSGLRYPGLVLIMDRILADHGVDVVRHNSKVPTLVLSGESLNPVVVTVNNNGGASAYLLDYAVTFVVLSANGKPLTAPKTVRVQREYDFDPLNILSMAREQTYLQKRMRIAAARQIVDRLAMYGSVHAH